MIGQGRPVVVGPHVDDDPADGCDTTPFSEPAGLKNINIFKKSFISHSLDEHDLDWKLGCRKNQNP